jgi:hypothetical protein
MADPQGTATVPTAIITGRTIREAEANFVLSHVRASLAKRMPYEPVWQETFNSYMVASPTAQWGRTRLGLIAPHFRTTMTPPYFAATGLRQSYLKDPETHQIIESIVAQALLLLLGEREYISATPIGDDDYEKARLEGRLLQAQMEQPGVFRTHYGLFKNCFLFGTSVLEMGWETKSRLQITQKPVSDAVSGAMQMQSIVEEVIYRDRPTQREIPLWDFHPDPGGTRIHEDMTGVCKRFQVTAYEAQALAEAGVYDKEGVRTAIATKRAVKKGGPRDFDHIPLPEGMEVLEGFEYWGYSPVKTPDRATNRVITLLEGTTVRSHINPFLGGGIPFKEVVANPVSGRFYGLSPAETIRFLQDSADNMLMVLNDAADMAVRGPLLVGGAFGGDTDKLKFRQLNDIILCRDVKAVAPVPVDLSVLSLAASELLRRKMSMRETTGATNPLQSIPSGDRTTATEVNALVRFASQRVEAMATLIERDDYPWIGNTLHMRNRQFIPPGGAVAALGGEQFEVPFEAIDVDLDVRFVGTRTAASKFQRAASLKEAVTVIASSLPLIPIMPELIERYLRDGLDIVDGKEIMTNAVLRSSMLQQAQEAAQANQPQPTSPKGSPSPPKHKQPTPGSPEAAQASYQSQGLH